MASARHAMTRDGENGRIANKVVKSRYKVRLCLWVTLACSSSSMYATHRTEHSAHRLHTVLLCEYGVGIREAGVRYGPEREEV